MINDENTALLLGLGLTLNQAKVYLAILKLQKTTVGQVARAKTNNKGRLPVIKCSCGAKILFVPDVKFMGEEIEAHADWHKQKVKNPVEAEAEAERIRDDLIKQVFDKASKA